MWKCGTRVLRWVPFLLALYQLIWTARLFSFSRGRAVFCFVWVLTTQEFVMDQLPLFSLIEIGHFARFGAREIVVLWSAVAWDYSELSICYCTWEVANVS